MNWSRIPGVMLVVLLAGTVPDCWSQQRSASVVPATTSPGPPSGLLKEPTYQSKAPGYCLLAFGPEAKQQIWLVFDSVPDPLRPGNGRDRLHVDRNGNLDLTDEGECIEATVQQQDSDSFLGGVRPTTVPLLEFMVGDIAAHGRPTCKNLMVQVNWFQGGERHCTISATAARQWPQRSELHRLVFARSVAEAPVLHFGGQLTMRFALGSIHSFSRSQPTELSAEVGTPGKGEGTFVSLTNTSFPKDLHPVARVEFPHREADQPPIAVTVVLSERC